MSSLYFTSNSVTLGNSLQMRLVASRLYLKRKFWENLHFRVYELPVVGILATFLVKAIFLKLEEFYLILNFINKADSYTCESDLPLLWNILIATSPALFQPRVLQVFICTSVLEDPMGSGIR